MPRQSSAALSVHQAAAVEVPRPDVPYDLTEAEGAVWNAVVSTMPADYFSPAQLPMLKMLCQMVVEAADLKRRLDAEKARRRPNAKYVSEKRRDWMQVSNMVVNLMRQMRLTHQSVYFAQTAGSRQKAARQAATDALWASNEDDLADA